MIEPVKLNLHDFIFSCCQVLRNADDFSLKKEIYPNLTCESLFHDLLVIEDCEKFLLSPNPFAIEVHYYSIIYFIEHFEELLELGYYDIIDDSLFHIVSVMRDSIEFITLKNYVKEIKLL